MGLNIGLEDSTMPLLAQPMQSRAWTSGGSLALIPSARVSGQETKYTHKSYAA
jgi:hypothetical protein